MQEYGAVPQWILDWVGAWNDRDAEVVAAMLTDDVRYRDLALGEDLHGRDEVRTFMEGMSQTWSSDYRFTAHGSVQSGDLYSYEWTVTGTNDRANPALGLPATGAAFEIPGISTGRLAGGRIADNRDYWNLAGYLMQIGLMPASPPPSRSRRSRPR